MRKGDEPIIVLLRTTPYSLRPEGFAMILVLVRHGESEGNAGVAFAEAEPHLTERGRRQAAYAAERARLRPYTALYTSPMSRALETASALSGATGLSPIVGVEFCEHRQLAGFRGLSRSALQARY